MPQSIELISPTLGLDPYALIEVKPDDDPDNAAGFTLGIRAGGGIGSNDELTCLLLLVVEELTGVTADLYIREVDMLRRAAGLPPLPVQERGSGSSED